MTQLLTRAAAAALFVVCAAVPAAAQQILEQVLVKVNGEILTKTELEQMQISALREKFPQLNTATVSDAELQTMLRDITPEVLAGAIDEMLMLQRGRELGYRLTDERFKNIVEDIKKTNNIPSDEVFQQALQQEGLSLDEFRRMIERRTIVAGVEQAEVLPKLTLTEQEAREYYEARPAEFTSPATVTIRELLIPVASEAREGGQSFNVAEDEAALEKIRKARERAMAGESFEALVQELSDSPSKANGGLIGPIVVNELSDALQKTIAALEPGGVSEPLRTPRGYQLLKLESRSVPAVQAFDDVRDLIADKIAAEKSAVERVKFIERLREQAIIEWKNDELKQLYEQHLARAGS